MQWKELYDKAAEKLAPRAVSPFIEAAAWRRHSHRGGKCLHRGVHRHRLYAGHVRGAQRHRQYDHERGEPHCAAGVRDGGWARGNALPARAGNS